MTKKKRLTSQLTLYFNKLYPIYSNQRNSKRYEVYLGIGGNIGDMFRRFDTLFKWFQFGTDIVLKETSPLLKNPPFGYLEQEYFLNGIIKIETNITPKYLLTIMQKYEKKFGRVRTFKDAPRTLDIDIIFIRKNNKDVKINRKDLVVPHIGWRERNSVKIPLGYMKRKMKSKSKVGIYGRK